MRAERPVCEHCGERPAVCRGEYASMLRPVYACDACCLHSTNFGRCEPLTSEDPRAYVS
jgi:hypothetical protein